MYKMTLWVNTEEALTGHQSNLKYFKEVLCGEIFSSLVNKNLWNRAPMRQESHRMKQNITELPKD